MGLGWRDPGSPNPQPLFSNVVPGGGPYQFGMKRYGVSLQALFLKRLSSPKQVAPSPSNAVKLRILNTSRQNDSCCTSLNLQPLGEGARVSGGQKCLEEAQLHAKLYANIGMLGATAGYAPTVHFYPALCATLLQGSTHVGLQQQIDAYPRHKILNLTALLLQGATHAGPE